MSKDARHPPTNAPENSNIAVGKHHQQPVPGDEEHETVEAPRYGKANQGTTSNPLVQPSRALSHHS